MELGALPHLVDGILGKIYVPSKYSQNILTSVCGYVCSVTRMTTTNDKLLFVALGCHIGISDMATRCHACLPAGAGDMALRVHSCVLGGVSYL